MRCGRVYVTVVSRTLLFIPRSHVSLAEIHFKFKVFIFIEYSLGLVVIVSPPDGIIKL